MSRLAFVASAISSIINCPVKTYDECVANGWTILPSQILDVDSIFKKSLIYVDIKDSISAKDTPSYLSSKSNVTTSAKDTLSYLSSKSNVTTSAKDIPSYLSSKSNVTTSAKDIPSYPSSKSNVTTSAKDIPSYLSSKSNVTTSTKDTLSYLSSKSNITYTQIFLKPLVGDSQSMLVDTSMTVLELKQAIYAKFGCDVKTMRFTFSGKQLEDKRTLTDYKVHKGCTIEVLYRALGGIDFYVIEPDLLDPLYDYDFRNINDGGRVFTRGYESYRRPCGWERIALNVSSRYGSDNRWLGCVGNSSYEWPVSYHGTRRENAESITHVGYLTDCGIRFAYGRGIYSTPEIDIARQYATEFNHEGTRYKVVIQNRVNPLGLERYNYNLTTWLTPIQENIRPYGLCVKRVDNTELH